MWSSGSGWSGTKEEVRGLGGHLEGLGGSGEVWGQSGGSASLAYPKTLARSVEMWEV